MKNFFWVIFFLLMSTYAQAELVGEVVEYGKDLQGYLVYDDSFKERRPGILVVHEWWGHNAYARKRADMLAELGYVALAVDMYGNGKTAGHPDQAGEFSSAVMQHMDTVGKERFEAAMGILKKHYKVNSKQIAAIGYCFGGATVLHMARLGVDLKGVASFHGSYATQTPAQPGEVKAKVLVCHGADDSFSSPEQITAFKKEMDDAQVNYKFITYEGAKHSFTNPDADEYAKEFNLDIGYNAEADAKSWQELQTFLKEIFQK